MKTSKFNLYVFVVIACVVVFIYCAYNFWIMVQPKNDCVVTSTSYLETEADNDNAIEDIKPSEITEQTEATKPTETVQEETIDKIDKDETEEPNIISLGKFRLTAYCPCAKCCGRWSGYPTASGVMPVANHTIAVDTDIISFGTEVFINEKIYVAEDTGSSIYGNRIDIYFDTHKEALEFGIQYAEVFVIKE